MKAVLYYEDWKELNNVDAKDIEVIVSPEKLAKLGLLNFKDSSVAFEQLKNNAIFCTLEWTILMTEKQFDRYAKIFTSYIHRFDSVRVCDFGAAYFILKKFPKASIDLELESNSHNLAALKAFVKVFGNSLRKVILSYEIELMALSKLIDFLNLSGVESEILAAGPLLLFYSPRNLLKAQYPTIKDSRALSVKANSQESYHSGFTLVDNIHGTFMFHKKNLYLLDKIEILCKINLTSCRLGQCLKRFCGRLANKGEEGEESEISWRRDAIASIREEKLGKHLKSLYKTPNMAGFFNKNKSTVLFSKLKNQNILTPQYQHDSKRYVGQIISVQKPLSLALSIKNTDCRLKLGERIIIKTPEGKIKEVTVTKLTNLDHSDLDETNGSQSLVLISFVKGVPIKSQLFYHTDLKK